MQIFFYFLSSNAVQLAVTLMAGILVYLILFCIPSYRICSHSDGRDHIVTKNFFILGLEFLGIVFLSIAIFCFLFDLFETYQFSDIYKRTFGPFSDGSAFAYLFFLNVGLFSKKKRLVVISAILTLFTGSKIALIAFALSIVFYKFVTPKQHSHTNSRHYLLVPLVTYVLVLSVSNFVLSERIKENVQNFVHSVAGYESKPLGRGACKSLTKCADTQVVNAVKQRFLTTVAGIWMTYQGGYGGAEYPGTAEKFADFMMHHNPYGMNDYYNLNWNFWASAGAVQNPYVNIGSGYGYIGFIAITLLLFGTAFRGMKLLLLKSQDFDSGDGMIAFFILLVFINQTQQWIQSTSILLFLSGLCMAHIWKVELFRRIKKND